MNAQIPIESRMDAFRERWGGKVGKMLLGGEWREAASGETYSTEDLSTGEKLADVASAGEADIDAAVAAARGAFEGAWAKVKPEERARLINRLADLIEANGEELALTETLDVGRPIQFSRMIDVGGAVGQLRYQAGWASKIQGETNEISAPGEWLNYVLREPVGVVGQIVPWNFPLAMACGKLGPALAAGCTVVLKPAEQTPLSIMVFAELIGDLLPAGVLNIVQGFGKEAGQALATSTRIAKIAFTGSTPVGSHIMRCAAENIIPSTVELGGKSPNIFFEDIMNAEPAFIEKAAEGLVLAFFNQGEVCTCPSRALIQESIFEPFMEVVMKKIKAIKRGNPLDTDTMVGAQASEQQFDKILSYMEIAQQEGAQILTGGNAEKLEGSLSTGYYVQPTLIKGHNKMRVFQEEIFGPVVGVATFKDEAEALAIANDTEFGLGAGVWTRDINRAYRMGRGIKAGRVWTNCYHLYPAHAAFGGYKKSGVGRETHKMMLDHYQQTKNLLVSYDINPLGFF